MMERTEKTLKKMQDIMNTNTTIQAQMQILADAAVEKGISLEEWESFKINLMTSLMYQMAERIPEIKKDMAMDMYESLREA